MSESREGISQAFDLIFDQSPTIVTMPGTKAKTFTCPRILDFNPPLESQHQGSEKDRDWTIDWDSIKPCKSDSDKIHVMA